MKKLATYLPPAGILLALLLFSLANGAAIHTLTEGWQRQLAQAEGYALAEDWEAAETVLGTVYRDWTARQTYLHVIASHQTVDDAEAMFRRLAARAAGRDLAEFRVELADLDDQLRLLWETERPSIKNIL